MSGVHITIQITRDHKRSGQRTKNKKRIKKWRGKDKQKLHTKYTHLATKLLGLLWEKMSFQLNLMKRMCVSLCMLIAKCPIAVNRNCFGWQIIYEASIVFFFYFRVFFFSWSNEFVWAIFVYLKNYGPETRGAHRSPAYILNPSLLTQNRMQINRSIFYNNCR